MKTLRETNDYHLYHSTDACFLCVLIHGYGGNHTKNYWGKVPEFLKYESELSETDICFWGYPSSKSPTANLLSMVRRGRKIATIPENENGRTIVKITKGREGKSNV